MISFNDCIFNAQFICEQDIGTESRENILIVSNYVDLFKIIDFLYTRNYLYFRMIRDNNDMFEIELHYFNNNISKEDCCVFFNDSLKVKKILIHGAFEILSCLFDFINEYYLYNKKTIDLYVKNTIIKNKIRCSSEMIKKIFLSNIISNIEDDKMDIQLLDLLQKDFNFLSMGQLENVDYILSISDNLNIMLILNKLISNLKEKNRMILYDRYFSESTGTLSQLGIKYNLTRERIRQIEKKCISYISRMKDINILRFDLKALSPNKSFISENTLKSFGLSDNIIHFFEKLFPDFVYNLDFRVLFFDVKLNDLYTSYITSLPNEFYNSDIINIYNVLRNKDREVVFRDVSYLLDIVYKQNGSLYCKNRISYEKICDFILSKYFPSGIEIYKPNQLQLFRDATLQHFGIELPEDRTLQNRITKECSLVDKGKWKLIKYDVSLNDEFKLKIINFINDSIKPIVLIRSILDKFSESLNDIGINNRYQLYSVLSKSISDLFYVKREHIYKDKNMTYYEMVELYIRDVNAPVTKNDLFTEFPDITESMIQNVCDNTKVLNMNGYYFHLDNMEIYDEEKMILFDLIDVCLSDHKIHHFKELFTIVEKKLNGFINRVGITDYSKLYFLVKELYLNDFIIERPFICRKDVFMCSAETQIMNEIKKEKVYKITDIRNIAKKIYYYIDSYIDFINRNDNAIAFLSNEYILNLDYLSISIEQIRRLEEIIDEFINNNDYRYVYEFKDIYKLPNVGYSWNEWLLYSIVNKYSKRYKAVLSSNDLKTAYVILADRSYSRDYIIKLNEGSNHKMPSIDDMLDNLEDYIDYDDLGEE